MSEYSDETKAQHALAQATALATALNTCSYVYVVMSRSAKNRFLRIAMSVHRRDVLAQCNFCAEWRQQSTAKKMELEGVRTGSMLTQHSVLAQFA